jgi:hypothetical protein
MLPHFDLKHTERKRKIHNLTSPLPTKKTLVLILWSLLVLFDAGVGYLLFETGVTRVVKAQVIELDKSNDYELKVVTEYGKVENLAMMPQERSKLKKGDMITTRVDKPHGTFILMVFTIMMYIAANGVLLGRGIYLLFQYGKKLMEKLPD